MKKSVVVGRGRLCDVVKGCRKLAPGEAIVTRCRKCKWWFGRRRARGRPTMYCSDLCAAYARADQRIEQREAA